MLPDKRLLAIILLLSSLFLIANIIKYLDTPTGSYYAAYDSDEIAFMGAEKSYIWNFISPWFLRLALYR